MDKKTEEAKKIEALEAKVKQLEAEKASKVAKNTPKKVKANMLHRLKDVNIIITTDVYNDKQKVVALEDYEFVESSAILVSPVDFQRRKGEGPERLAIKSILPQTFLQADSVLQIQTKTDSGLVPFKLSSSLQDAALEAFIILLACTEKTKEGEYTKKSRDLISKRFDLSKEVEIERKQEELNLLSWGNIKAEVSDILHFPNYEQGATIPEKCTPKAEAPKRNIPKLPKV